MESEAMRIEFHPQLLELQRYSCNCCGQCCRSFLVGVHAQKMRDIEALRDWRKELGVEKLFIRHRAVGRAGWGLAKHADGRCVFLGNDNLCAIHKLHGLKAKPRVCRLYPFVLTPLAGTMQVGLRFDCPTVCDSRGRELGSYRSELDGLTRQLISDKLRNMEVPNLYPGCRVPAERIEAVNESLIKIITSDALPLVRRLVWMWRFIEHIGRVKWQQASDDDFVELLGMFRGSLLAELQQNQCQGRPVTRKSRRMLGQVFFLLTQPTAIVTGHGPGLFAKLRQRLALTRQMKQLAEPTGTLPRIQPDWPDCDLADLEASFGTWPADVEQVLTRYMVGRLAGAGYCGANFYHYSLTEGTQSLLLAMVTVGWVMRIAAIGADRDHLDPSDAHKAMMVIDGNLGYASALGFGPGRLRLRYLGEHLESFLESYCD